MKKNYLFTLILSVFLLLSFSSCDMFQPEEESIEVVGEWSNQDEKASITSNSFIKYYRDSETDNFVMGYECAIAEFSNDNFNAGESGDGDCGYAVIKYTTPPSYNPDAKDKYGIIRWQDLSSNAMNFSEAYYDPDPTDDDFTAVYFDTAADAKANMTNVNNCFSMYSAVEKSNG